MDLPHQQELDDPSSDGRISAPADEMPSHDNHEQVFLVDIEHRAIHDELHLMSAPTDEEHSTLDNNAAVPSSFSRYGGAASMTSAPTDEEGYVETVAETPEPIPSRNIEGGRLWRLAGELTRTKQPPRRLLGKTANQIKESIMTHMQSRADPDALVAPPTPPRPDPRATQSIMVKMTNGYDDHYREEEAFLMNTGVAHKRVRVVQLLIIGLFGLLLGWLGNFFVSSSCYFVSAPIEVGQSGEIFYLHFGLWNYSPIDSALNGYKYCYPYGGQHSDDAPVPSRVVNLAALLAGTYSLVILWFYLISGRLNARLWAVAVYSAFAAGILQFLTPILFFTGGMCRTSTCSIGPAFALSAVTAVAWAVLGAELHYQCPFLKMPEDEPRVQINPAIDASTNSKASSVTSTTVAQLEMADLAGASQEYLERFHRKVQRHRYKPPELS